MWYQTFGGLPNTTQWSACLPAIAATTVAGGRREYVLILPRDDRQHPQTFHDADTSALQCDEQRPSCTACLRAGWACPGYAKHWKFVDETSRLGRYYATRKFVYDSVHFEMADQSSNFDEDDLTLAQTVVDWRISTFPRACNSRTYLQRTKMKVPRFLKVDSLGSALVYSLHSKVRGTLVPLSLIGSFFDFVPARLGHSAALDDAVSCVCAIYHSTVSIPYHLHPEISQSYVKALSSMRAALEDSSLRMGAETLCASILLQLCEVSSVQCCATDES